MKLRHIVPGPQVTPQCGMSDVGGISLKSGVSAGGCCKGME